MSEITLPKVPTSFSIQAGDDPKRLLDVEWILTNGIGGFAYGTAAGIARKKYHALLNASANPPVERFSTIFAMEIEIEVDGETYQIHALRDSANEVPGSLAYLKSFDRSMPWEVSWVYEIDGDHTPTITVVVAHQLRWRCNVANTDISATTSSGQIPIVRVRPVMAMRDYHDVLKERDEDRIDWSLNAEEDGFEAGADGARVTAVAPGLTFVEEEVWYPSVFYDRERDRGLPDTEDLFSPGYWTGKHGLELESIQISWALAPFKPSPQLLEDVHRTIDMNASFRSVLSVTQFAPDISFEDQHASTLRMLVYAADDFLVEREVNGRKLKTVIAGYPWFADWGRDTMIALPGLMLTTKRFDDAMGCLETFAAHVDRGMIPNRFDDYGGPPHYNTVDASLWFLHAVREYVRASGDMDGAREKLLPACHEIIAGYRRDVSDGAMRYNIGTDPSDHLIVAGDETTQLTWMDAKRDGVVFTPRHGKAVEINALWHHGLRCIADLIREEDRERARDYAKLASEVRVLFMQQFKDEETGALHDCLRPDASGGYAPTGEVRPNQIFSASLEFGPLDDETRLAVVNIVRERLLTPMGLRTLERPHPRYRPEFTGDMMNRDDAYHNGTVWPWLIGHYCEAVLRAGAYSPEAKQEAARAISPLIETMNRDCLGQIAEVYSGDAPHGWTPDDAKTIGGTWEGDGCTAQAWSVAEVLRIAAIVTA